jgi:hypothetical protein
MKHFAPLLFLLFLAPAIASAQTAPTPKDPLAEGVQAVSSYDYGRDRTAIVQFDTYIRSQPGDRPKVEAALLPLLAQANISTGAKDYICRWLGVIGSEASIPALEKVIDDPDLSQLAVSAFLRLDTPAARAALLQSLATAPPALRPAIIGAMGRAGMNESVPAQAGAASSGPSAEAAAALDALGDLGTPEALAALRAASVAAPLESARGWALVHAAGDVLMKDAGSTDAAKGVLTSLLELKTAPATLRVAAASAYVQADPAGAAGALLTLLKSDDSQVRTDAARLTPLLSADGLKSLAVAFQSLEPAVQIAIVKDLAETGDVKIDPVLQAALAGTQQPGVRLSAIAAYGTANLPDSASVLFPLLAKGGDEAAVATAGLGKLTQPDMSTRLKSALAGAPAPVKADLLLALANRKDRSAFDLFLASTGDADPAVAKAAFQGIAAVAGGDDLTRLTGLLPRAATGAEHKSLNTAILRCARTAADKDQAVDFLAGALQNASPAARSILLTALASVPSAKATATLQTQLGAPGIEARKEVIRALSAAHTPDADSLLLEAAGHGPELSVKILALRGYLDNISAEAAPLPQRVLAYRKAWSLATRPEEREAILAALKHTKGKDAARAFAELSAQAPAPPSA